MGLLAHARSAAPKCTTMQQWGPTPWRFREVAARRSDASHDRCAAVDAFGSLKVWLALAEPAREEWLAFLDGHPELND